MAISPAGSLRPLTTRGKTTRVPGRSWSRSSFGLYWRSSHTGTLYFWAASTQTDSPRRSLCSVVSVMR